MQKIIFTRGLPASGKTSWAKGFIEERGTDYGEKWKRINKDDLRAMLDNGNWSRDKEKFILTARDMLLLSALTNGFNVIIDDTGFAPKHEEQFKKLLEALYKDKKIEVKLEVKDFTSVSLEECLKRDSERAKPVGAKAIIKMYNTYLRPPVKKVEVIKGLPDAIICDIDGTLALFDGNPYDRDFSKDVVAEEVKHIVNNYHSMGFRTIIVSGRKNKHFEVTQKWLEDNNILYDELHMPRSESDWRKDYILKEEIYNDNIKGKYNVFFVLDDRDQVVRLWRNLGLKCLQVADGDF